MKITKKVNRDNVSVIFSPRGHVGSISPAVVCGVIQQTKRIYSSLRVMEVQDSVTLLVERKSLESKDPNEVLQFIDHVLPHARDRNTYRCPCKLKNGLPVFCPKLREKK